MRGAHEVSAQDLDLVIGQFVEDFEDIIRRHVELALKQALGPGPRRSSRQRAASREAAAEGDLVAAPKAKGRAAPASRSGPKDTASSGRSQRKGRKPGASRPVQLSLF